MPAPRYRSRTFRRIRITTPGSQRKLHYELRKPRPAHCASCAALLKGVPRQRDYKMKTMAKTMKRPQRPFAGMLCTRCMRRKFISIARMKGE
jgi:large subunit ribosomal protein L34e